MAKPPKSPLVPTFSKNADIQKALEGVYLADQTKISEGGRVLTALQKLDGLKGDGFTFAISDISFTPQEKADENGYREPVGAITLTLKTTEAEEKLVIELRKAGDMTLPGLHTTNTKRVDHAILGWVVEMEEKYGFDTTPSSSQKEFASDRIAPGGSRPEPK